MNGIAIDIDNVLSATNLHWARELHKLFGYPEEKTPEEIMEGHVLAQHVTHWQTPEGKAWMDEFRRSNEKHAELPLIENANHMVNKVNAVVPVAAYITARWESVRENTEAWLSKHDFPKAPIYMRPMDTDGKTHAFEWKAQFVASQWPEIDAIVDDDPSLIEHLPEDYQGAVFLYRNTEHKEVSFPVIQCRGWEEVLKEVTERYGRPG